MKKNYLTPSLAVLKLRGSDILTGSYEKEDESFKLEWISGGQE